MGETQKGTQRVRSWTNLANGGGGFPLDILTVRVWNSKSGARSPLVHI